MSSEILGEDVPLIYINNLFDTDKDGDLSLLVYLKGDISQGKRIIDSAMRKADIFRFLNRVSVCCLL